MSSSKFDNYGDSHTGILVEGDVTPQTDPNNGEVKYRKDGVTPIMQLVITWDTDARDPQVPNDTGRRKLYCSWRLEAEIKRAYRAAGAEGLEEGGELTVTYLREEKVPNQPGKAKIYEAVYVPPRKGIPSTSTPDEDTIPAEKVTTVKSLFDSGQDIALITQVTGLTQAQVEGILEII